MLETPNRSFDTGKPAYPGVRNLGESSYTKIKFNVVSSEEAMGGLYLTINDKSSSADVEVFVGGRTL